jgi:DNA-binding response OmpR family regulator
MKKRVLVVEDDPVLTRVLNDNLSFEGFEVQCVSDGNAATSAAKDRNGTRTTMRRVIVDSFSRHPHA